MSLTAEQIGQLARAALEQEARLTPKPGLVDAENSGAHDDMDLALLLKSASVLEPFFAQFAAQGMLDAALSPEGRLATIRANGREAEAAMFAATNGINTHKGALFLIGTLCYVAGHCAANEVILHPQFVCTTAARVCRGITQELGTNAGRAYAHFGARGARGEAEDGFPHALLAAEAYAHAKSLGAGEDDAWLLALLQLIATIDDANVLARCGEETAHTLGQRAGEIALRYPAGGSGLDEEISALDCDCRSWNASPGGAADLLACAMFLHTLTENC